MNLDELHKYPSTPHFDFSLSLKNDDRKLQSMDGFNGKRVIVTEKLDGENATIYNGYYHPRSLIDDGHPSRDWLKGFKANFDYEIPQGWRICGENMFAQHSIVYEDLESYFYCFNIWNEENYCLSYDETLEYCKLLNIKYVPVLYEGKFDYQVIKEIFFNLDHQKQEGIVVRVAHEFHYNNFSKYYAKAVRKNHVQTDEHWMKKKVEPNKLKL